MTRRGAEFAGTIQDGWDVGGNANGGYLMAMAARAMATEGASHPIALNAHFLSPGRPGRRRHYWLGLSPTLSGGGPSSFLGPDYWLRDVWARD